MSTQDGKFWTRAWNPIHVKGGGYFCTRISPGCQNCWCYTYNKRFGNGLPFNNRHQVEFELDQRILEQPLHWKKPRVIAVQWLGDLGHEQIPDLFIKNIIFASEAYNWHKYLFLTKRIGRLKTIFDELYSEDVRPYDNLWLGVSISTQKEADEKIPILLQTLAAHRYINFEPLLENIDFRCPTCRGTGFYGDNGPGIKGNREYIACEICHNQKPDWIITGCESGHGRRPMKLEWSRNIVKQCAAAGVPCWVKQLDINGKGSKNMNEWDKDLRIRQWPF